MPSLVTWCAILALALAACSSSSASSGSPNGGACSGATACGGGLCAISQDFPQGYCTQGCQLANPSSCPGGSVCIDDVSGVPSDAGVTAICYQACALDTECTQQGFKCLEKASKKVCRNAL
jgi:hypothetical protein